MKRSNLSRPISVEIVIVPDENRVAQAMQAAALGYRRALIQKLKEQKPYEPQERA